MDALHARIRHTVSEDINMDQIIDDFFLSQIYNHNANHNQNQLENINLQGLHNNLQFENINDDQQNDTEKLPELINYTESKHTNNDDDQCTICYDNGDDIIFNDCKHKVCTNCYKKILTNRCPFCRIKITSYKVKIPKKISCGKRICSMLRFSKSKSE
jgi:hypothetical protein